MRLVFLRFGACVLVLGDAWAQNAGESQNAPQLPVGQTFKQFEWPIYQQGTLKATLDATEAKGITLNRAETTDLRIQVYDNGAVTSTVTSPKADLYVAEQKMRTKNTVQIDRADMEATSQDCDFDLKAKKYVLRTNVKVTLKHFDLTMNPTNGTATTPASSHAPAKPSPVSPASPPSTGTLLDSPGTYSDPHSGAASSPAPDSK